MTKKFLPVSRTAIMVLADFVSLVCGLFVIIKLDINIIEVVI